MDSNFANCLQIILASEGGFVDDPADPGGATNRGVTLATLSGWRKVPQTIADVQALTVDDVTPIYRALYWNTAHCPSLPAGLDLMVFDEAVNAGPGHAVKHLQEALGVNPDGQFGVATITAAAGGDAASAISRLAGIREAYYRALPGFGRFGVGWLARLSRTEADALKMAGAA